MRSIKNETVSFLKKYRFHILYISFFVVMTLFFSFSVLDTFSTHVPGEAGDTFGSIQRLETTKRRIVSAFSSGAQGGIGYVWENKLEFFDLKFYGSLLTFFVSDIEAYNIIWISSFFLDAVFMYFLILHLTKNRYSAFLSGILYSFAPVHFAYGNGFAGAMHLELIPLFVLFLIRFLEKFTFARLILLAISFALLSLTENHFGFFAILFSIPVLIYYLLKRHKKGDLITNQKIKYILTFFIACIFIGFVFYDLLITAFSENNYLEVGIEELIPNSLDLLSFAIPSLHHPFWGAFFGEHAWNDISEVVGIIRQKHFSEISGFVSYTGIFFFVVGIIFWKRAKNGLEILFWGTMAILMYILSLGPYLSVFGPLNKQIPLPGLLLFKYFPFMENIRTVGRIFPFALIAFTIVFAYGVNYVLQKIPKKSILILFGIILILLSFEFVQVPPKVKIERPSFIEQMAQDQGSYRVLNINSSFCYVCANEFLYYNAIHGKPTVGGMWFGRPKPGFSFEKTTPFVKEILYDLALGRKTSQSVIKHNFTSFSNSYFTELGIKYLVLDTRWMFPDEYEHKQKDSFLTPSKYMTVKEGIEDNIEVEIAYQDKNILVYEVMPSYIKDYVLVKQPTDTMNHFKTDPLNNDVEFIELTSSVRFEYANYSTDDLFVEVQFSNVKKETLVEYTIDGKPDSLILTPDQYVLKMEIPKIENNGTIILEVSEGDLLKITSIDYNKNNLSDS